VEGGPRRHATRCQEAGCPVRFPIPEYLFANVEGLHAHTRVQCIRGGRVVHSPAPTWPAGAVPPTKGWCRLRTTPVHPQSRRQSRSAQNSLSTRLAHSRSPRTLDALRSVPDDAMASACPQCRRRLRHLVERGSRALVSWELVLSVRAGSVPAWCLRLQTLHAAHQLLQLSHYGVSR
jgi:hypothetical protein